MPNNREALAYVQGHNRRHRKPIPRQLQDAAKFPPVHIFNIYQMEHRISLGGLGHFFIPACELGADYSAPCVLKGMIVDEYDEADGNGKMNWTTEDGRDVAKDVVGIGSTLPGLGLYTTNREWWGVFIAVGETPTVQELDAAKAKLDQNMTLWVQNGDALALQGAKGLEQIGPNHRKAAAWKKQKRDWATIPETMVSCPGCQEPIRPGVVKHSCGAVLDWDKAIELGIEKSRPMPPPQTEPARPRASK